MSGLLFVIGLFYLVYYLLKDAFIRPLPKDFDIDKAYRDSVRNNLSTKEFNRRAYSGCYKKDEDK